MNYWQQAAHILNQKRYVVALTGAGISVESGIPDFRSSGGLWSRYDPMEYGHIESFRAKPSRVWQMLLDMDHLVTKAAPNPAHYALAELERIGILKHIITQNIDGLHQKAGSRNVIEFHGHNRTLRCDRCSRNYVREDVIMAILPPLCQCGGFLRPNFVFFGESIPADVHEQALAAANACDMMIIVGTSVSVAPASTLPCLAKARAGFILEINPAFSEASANMTDMHIPEMAGHALPAVVTALKALREHRGPE